MPIRLQLNATRPFRRRNGRSSWTRRPQRAREALAGLCASYRRPIVNWSRQKDFYQDPEDLTHSFVVYLIEQSLLSEVAPRTGKFRAFLADTMPKFLWDSWDRNGAQKRGRIVEKVSLSENDFYVGADGHGDSQLDLDLALVINHQVLTHLNPRPELKSYIFERDSEEGWDAIGARLDRRFLNTVSFQ